MSAWVIVVLVAYWLVVLWILGRIVAVCKRTNSDTLMTESTDEKE